MFYLETAFIDFHIKYIGINSYILMKYTEWGTVTKTQK